MRRVAVIGGGAAGMMAAITAANNGAAVTLYEKNDRVGKKILATGNGKCNFSNRDFSVNDYNGNGRNETDYAKLQQCFEQFSVEDAVAFFHRAGMLVKDKKGYLYPWSEQAATVLDILRFQLERANVKIRLSEPVNKISRIEYKKEKDAKVGVQTQSGSEAYDAIVVSCGGCAAAKTGSDGSGYRLAEQIGHRLVPVVPALVQLRCREDFFKIVAGVRCEARLRLCGDMETVQEETGELQFTDYGISGIPVFQLSREAAYLLKEKKQVAVYIDLFPGMEQREFEALCAERLRCANNRNVEEWLLGMANKKVNQLMMKLAAIKPLEQVDAIGMKRLKKLLYSYRELCVHVSETNSFENAQVTAGGVPLAEVSRQLQSLKVRGVYFAGEILDVDGRCGGYNLQWAWSSGYIAGKHAALGDKT